MEESIASMAAAASWGLKQWEHMEKYAVLIPKETPQGSFFRAVLSIHKGDFLDAQKWIDSARESLDTELTSMAGESYQRAYSAMVSVQMLAELEEVITYKLVPQRQPFIKRMWWERLQV